MQTPAETALKYFDNGFKYAFLLEVLGKLNLKITRNMLTRRIIAHTAACSLWYPDCVKNKTAMMTSLAKALKTIAAAYKAKILKIDVMIVRCFVREW